MKAPTPFVVVVATGEATPPHGMLLAVCAARHVEGFGVVPTVTVKPARAEPEVNSRSVLVKLGEAVGDGDGDLDGDSDGDGDTDEDIDGPRDGVVAEPPPQAESNATAITPTMLTMKMALAELRTNNGIIETVPSN